MELLLGQGRSIGVFHLTGLWSLWTCCGETKHALPRGEVCERNEICPLNGNGAWPILISTSCSRLLITSAANPGLSQGYVSGGLEFLIACLA